ncbi:BON domain-containing protein [Pseudoduganella sp. UC29_106]|uniref:BON domain-containing protein n=1 Tax=Pseudoduganella sp. UC29_106 TaxID=3374553 RepID=UPI003757A92B
MKRVVFLSAAALISTCALAQNVDRTAYKSAWDKAESDYKVAKDKCKSLKGNAEDVCKEEAKVALAQAQLDITQKYKNTPSDVSRSEHKVAEAQYDLAKERCDDQSGNAKSACKAEAKATYERTLAARGDHTTTGAIADNARDTGSNVAAATREKSADASAAMSDTMITTKVKAEMAADPLVKAMDVHVETQNGVVMLSGFVPSKAEADKAVEIARAVKDVRDVKSSIQVKK